MTARTTDHVVFMPSTMSHPTVAVQRPKSTSRPSGLEALFMAAVSYVVNFPRRLAVKNELQRLSDRELADIGLNRTDIASVFTRAR